MIAGSVATGSGRGPRGLVPGREEVAQVVLDASPLTALLLTSMIEWFTQLHYVEHVRDWAELDELFRDILRFHWIDESRHAHMDSLLIDEIAGELTADQRDRAIDQLLELGGAVDGLLGQQVELDIDARHRREANVARNSSEKSCGSSQAAKWPPLSTSLK